MHKLEKILQQTNPGVLLTHRAKVECPTCGAPGRLDLLPIDEVSLQDAVWWNRKQQHWECTECWLK